MLAQDIEAYVARTFDPSEQPAALAALGSAAKHDGNPPDPRFLRCALLAGRPGDLSDLRHWVSELAVDRPADV